jgi:hypothetical protein
LRFLARDLQRLAVTDVKGTVLFFPVLDGSAKKDRWDDKKSNSGETGMQKRDNRSAHFSPRSTLLIWVTGIVLGWGCAVVVVYQVIKGPESAINADTATVVADNKAAERALSAIEPAAGNPDSQKN